VAPQLVEAVVACLRENGQGKVVDKLPAALRRRV
jgi:hypothetical protein